jgi:hypothetical protein
MLILNDIAVSEVLSDVFPIYDLFSIMTGETIVIFNSRQKHHTSTATQVARSALDCTRGRTRYA